MSNAKSRRRANSPKAQRLHASSEPFPRLLNDREVAAICGLSIAVVRRWRLRGRGPRWLKLTDGGSVRYRPEDVSAWLTSSGVETQDTGREQSC